MLFFWFIKFPVYRFGLSYISCLFIFIFVYVFNSNNEKLYSKNFYILVIVIGLIAFYSKNIKRISENYYLVYNNYPWPKIYSLSDNEKNIKKILKRFQK